jgi:cephalosporin-C deacetylase-like acetyl esterase
VNTSPKIEVKPDHTNWLYTCGEKAVFIVSVNTTANVKLYYEAGLERMKPAKTGTVETKNGIATIDAGTLDSPGFLRCKVVIEDSGKKYYGMATAGFDPYQIKTTTVMPDGFTSFWTNTIAEAAKVPLDVKMDLLPERCTPKVNVYQASFQNTKPGSRTYGILCVPKAPGKYPAVLKVPGAGVRPYSGAIALAEKGMITLEMGIHGIPVNLDSSVYTSLGKGALDGYMYFNLDNKDNYYYKRVYISCLKAIDFIYTLPRFDGTTLALLGGSQGGALSIVTTALDSRVKYLVAIYPALSDLTGYTHGRAGGWPALFTTGGTPEPKKVETTQYYDVVNFARLLKVPGFYTWGYNDETCAPTSTFAAYNTITAPKEFFAAPPAGHSATSEQWDKVNSWLEQKLLKK